MDNPSAGPSQHDEEEYQFAETEENASEKYASSAASPSPAGSGGSVDKSNNKKRLLILVGIIIGIFCLYKLYGLFTSTPSSPTKSAVSAPAPAPTQPTQVTPPVAEQAPAIVAKPVPVAEAEDMQSAMAKDKISTLEQAVALNTKSQENVQNEIAGLSSAITEIQSNVAMLTQQINAVVQHKNQMEAKISQKEKAKTEVKRKVKSVTKSPKIPYSTYYIKALIQGRAWLINTNGATFTVSVGDQLPGYGQIQEINTSKGVVTTSSGRMISFMPQDR